VYSPADADRILAEESRRIDWLLGNVTKIHGTTGMEPVLNPSPAPGHGVHGPHTIEPPGVDGPLPAPPIDTEAPQMLPKPRPVPAPAPDGLPAGTPPSPPAQGPPLQPTAAKSDTNGQLPEKEKRKWNPFRGD
jgi:hypothetical protein